MVASSLPVATFTYAGPLEFLSETSYHLGSGPDCKDDYDEERSKKALLNRLEVCTPDNPSGIDKNVEELRIFMGKSPAVAEDLLFAELAREHSKNLKCASDFAKKLTSEDIKRLAIRIRLLREARQEVIAASAAINDPNLSTKVCPLTQPEVDKDFGGSPDHAPAHAACTRVVRARASYDAILSAIPLSGMPGFSNFLDKYANASADEAKSLDANLEAQAKAAYHDAGVDLSVQSGDLKTKADNSNGTEFGRTARYALLSDPRITEKVVASDPSGQLKPLVCSANTRYKDGADNLDTALFVGSMAMSFGAGALVRGSSIVARVYVGAMEARGIGVISAGAANVIRASAVALTTASSLQTVARACIPNDGPTVQVEACADAPKVSEFEKDECVLSASLEAFSSATVFKFAKDITRAKMLATTGEYKRLAEKLLGVSITRRQTDAILESHLVGKGEMGLDGTPVRVGNYTPAQLKRKAEILKEAGFNEEQRRKLIQSGLVGAERLPPVAPAAWPSATQSEFQKNLATARQARVGPRMRPSKSPTADIQDLETAVANQIGAKAVNQTRTISTQNGKVIMSYDPGYLGKKVQIVLNASNDEYYYTIIEVVNGKEMYLMMSPGRRGLVRCLDMALCHYPARDLTSH